MLLYKETCVPPYGSDSFKTLQRWDICETWVLKCLNLKRLKEYKLPSKAVRIFLGTRVRHLWQNKKVRSYEK